MHCSCVRQTDLPQTSRLAADVLYNPERSAAFFPHPHRDLESFKAAAREIRFTDDQRAALVSALAEGNPQSQALDRLKQPGTVVVATGQQVGLFSGPAYSIYKALHAAKLAEWLTSEGLPAVPVFWLATEDHDYAEVNHVWVFNSRNQPVRIEAGRAPALQPVGGIPLAAAPVDELRAALEGLPFSEEILQAVAASYPPGATMGAAFSSLLKRILAGFDILHLDPMLPQFRKLAAPGIRSALEAAPELSARLMERNRELTAAGYHAQVHVEDHTALVFLLENGKRMALRRQGSEYILNGRRFGTAELAERAESLSPNALLRPVVQDSMLPTVAVVGGNAEIAYFAQSEVIYRAVLGRMPVPVPRTSFTILDTHSEKLMDRYHLSLTDFFAGEEELRQRMASTLVPPALRRALGEASAAVDGALGQLAAQIGPFDPTLVRALERSTRKIRYQMQKIERKTGREAIARDTRAAQDSTSLLGLIYPERHLQERIYSILPFLARHGMDLPAQIYDAIQLDCPDHRIMVAG
jgi:bacillithiol biosynthesis cysteine-adding enzyme BshC